jgi:predicted CoA-binding protein
MPLMPDAVSDFLAAGRIAVAGVSRDARQPANAILRRLRDTGHGVVPVNPNATELEGERAYPDLRSVPGAFDAVMIATHPAVAAEVVRQAAALGVRKIWFHRSFGTGSVSDDALRECEARGIDAIVGGCPLMYCGKVDIGHRCFRWWLGRSGRVPV